MNFVFMALIIAVGLFFISPYGAARSVQWNRGNLSERQRKAGKPAGTVRGVQITGVAFVAGGVYMLIANLS